MSHFALNPKNHFLKKNLELLCIASTAVLISQVVSVLHFSQAGVAESNIKSSVCLFVSFKLPREYQISSDIVFRYSSTFQTFQTQKKKKHLHEKFACFIYKKNSPLLHFCSSSTFESSFGNGSISFHDVCGWKFILWDKFGK